MTDQDLQTIRDIAEKLSESADAKDRNMASCLFTISGSYLGGDIDLLADICVQFAKDILG